MTDQEDNFNLGKIVFVDNNQGRNSWACFRPNLFQISDCVSIPTFCHFVDHLWLLLENSPFKNLGGISCRGWNFVQCGRIHFTLTMIMNKVISTKNRVFISLVGPSETGESQLIYNWLKIGTF